MKKTGIIVVILFGAVLAQVRAGVVTAIPADRRAVIQSPEATWTPSAQQTDESLAVIQAYLENSTDPSKVTAVVGSGFEARRVWIAGEIQKILHNTAGYRVQFWGVEEGTKKIIICNFFPAAASGHPDPYATWQKDEVEVADGGFHFWRVLYDPLAKTVAEFDTNGYAFRGNENCSIHPRLIAFGRP